MSEADYADLVTAAHNQLAAPVILIWDNLNTHSSARMRAWIEAHADRLTVERLPAYAPRTQRGRGRLGPYEEQPGNLAAVTWASSPPSSRTGSRASSTGLPSLTASSPRPG